MRLKIIKFTKILITFSFILTCLVISGCKPSKTQEYQGYVEGELIFMASPFPGNLETLNVERGNYVKKGTLLFKLDSQPQADQLERAEANLANAKSNLINLEKGRRQVVIDAIEADINRTKANLELAKLRLDRNQKLYKKRAIDLDRVDAARVLYKARSAELKKLEANLAEAKLGSRDDLIEAQEAQVKSTQEQVEEAKWNLSQKTLSAPIDAIVYDTFFRPGEFVPANQAVVSLLAKKYLRIIFFIPVVDMANIKLGNTIQLECQGCKKTYTATISYISPEAEFTPPVIYSRDSDYKLVFRIKAIPAPKDAYELHPGQPVFVKLGARDAT